MRKIIHHYWIIFFAFLLVACANIVTPSGGQKDTNPPIVQKTIPPNKSLHFDGKSFKIYFNKFVKVTNAANEVVVSPFMREAPEIKIKGRAIVVNFKDTLKPAATYSVSFGKSIADINEGNVLINYRYILSTGNFIDSLSLKGTVKNAQTLKPESDILVMLYDGKDDSLPYKKTPFYIAKSDESGNYNFLNLKSGSYKIFALKDANNDYLYDQPGEKIAFIDSLIAPEPIDTAKKDSLKKKRSYDLLLFEEVPAKQKMLKASAVKYGKLLLVFRKPVENYSMKSLTGQVPISSIIPELSKTGDTVTLWLKNPDADSLVLQISENNKILDTAAIKLMQKNTKQLKGRGENAKIADITANVGNNGTLDFFRLLTFESVVPLAEYDFSNILIKENKDTMKAKFVFTDSVKRHLQFENKLKEGATYSVFISPGTFKDIFGTPNDTVKINFSTTSQRNYGNIKLTLKSQTLSCPLVVQLVTESENVVQEKFVHSSDVLGFPHVIPGNYRIKVICDENNNKIWDTGDYLKKKQPEKVFYYPAVITAKPDWDIELQWEISK